MRHIEEPPGARDGALLCLWRLAPRSRCRALRECGVMHSAALSLPEGGPTDFDGMLSDVRKPLRSVVLAKHCDGLLTFFRPSAQQHSGHGVQLVPRVWAADSGSVGDARHSHRGGLS